MSGPARKLLPVLLLLGLGVACVTAEEAKQADSLRELGLTYLHEGDTPGAIETFRKALELNPKDARVHHELGLAYFSRNLYPEAEREMLEALALDPTLSEARLNLASLYVAAGRYEDAIPLLQAVVDDPVYRKPYRAWCNLGWAYHQLGRVEEAEAAYKQALAIAPSFCQAHYNRGLLWEEQGDFGRAERSYEKAATNCPQDARYLFSYGVALVRLERHDEARRYLERVSNADPEGELGARAREYLQVLP